MDFGWVFKMGDVDGIFVGHIVSTKFLSNLPRHP